MKLSLSLNWIKSSRDVTELNVCRSRRCRAFGTWNGWITKTFDYINRVTNAFAFGLRGYVDTLSPLIAMHLLDRSCMIVDFCFGINAFPNSGIRAMSMRRCYMHK